MEKRTFIGGTDVDLLTSFMDSFIYEDMSHKENCQPGEIRVTVFANMYVAMYVDSRYCTKEELLQFIDDFADDSFFSFNDTTRDDYNKMETHQIFADVLSYFGMYELGMMIYDASKLEDWYNTNAKDSNIDFTIEDVRSTPYI
jgi:hypothetical protein